MTSEERAIQILKQRECCRECVVENCTCAECDKAFDLAFNALEREQKFLDAGYKNGRVEFMIGGRKFMVKEMAQ